LHVSNPGFFAEGLFRVSGLALVTVALATGTASPQGGAPVATPTPRRGEVHGRVVNAANQTPIAGARVELRGGRGADSVARAAARADGSFAVPGLRAGSYRVRISALGYTPREIAAVTVSASVPEADVGTIALTASALELRSVVVRDRKGEADLSPDRNSFVVKDLPSSKGGTVLDVLRNIPSVDVDIDNIVSLRGNTGVVVQINGRPSPMKAAQLGNFLGQLPAELVDKVEVVSNPSAKEDPTGVAGIINIVLKEEADAGTSGGLTLGGVTTGTASIGGNVGWQKGPLNLFGSYGLMNDRRVRTEGVTRDNLYVVPTTYLAEGAERVQKPLMHTLTGSATWSLGKHDELSAEALFSTRVEPETYALGISNFDPNRVVSSRSDRYTDGTNHENSLETTLGYRHTFAQKGHKLTGELRFNQGLEGGPTTVVAHALALDGTPMAVSARESATGWEHPGDIDLRVDYVRPFSKVLRLEAGYKGSMQRFHTTLDTRVLDLTQNVFVPDSTRISDFNLDQVVNAAYGMLSAQWGKFTWQGGFRAEHATTSFHLVTRGATYDQAYDEAFPSGLVVYHVDDARQVKLSYSTRIRRADDTDLLDPTPHFLDPLNISRGNPNLKPEIIRAVELGLQQSTGQLTLQVTPYFRRTFDAVRTLRTIDSLGVSTRTFANISTSDASGLDVTVAMNGGRLSGFAGASAYRQVSNASNIAQGLSVNAFGWSARTNATFRFTKKIDAQALLSYQAPVDVEQGHNAARTRLSFAAREKFLDDQLSVTLRILDPFSMTREGSTTIDPRFYQVSDRRRTIRGVGVAFSWTFGKPDAEHGKNDLIGEPTQ
jgi:ferric enterobactin receptor